MKSARERAYGAAEAAGLTPSDSRYLPFVDVVEMSFAQHAVDQRSLCVEAVTSAAEVSSSYGAVERIRTFVSVAPSPGEKP